MLSPLFVLHYFASLALATPINSTTTDCPSCDHDATACHTRSVWSLLASCGLTLLICVWHAIHPALPLPHFKWYHIVATRLCLMLVAFIAPEIIIVSAVIEWCEAKRVTKEIHDRGYQWWTRTHSHFILNGGFVLRDDTGLSEIKVDEFLQLLDANEILNPIIAEADIKDKSSSGGLEKAIFIVQLSWFMIQVVARLVNHLTVTLVELDTVSLALLTLPLVFCWWYKPRCVKRPLVFYKRDANRQNDPEVSPDNDSPNLLLDENRTIRTTRRAENFLFPVGTDQHLPWFASLFLTWMMFGALHLMAWDYEFPSVTEKDLWRVASLALAASPIFFQLGAIIANVHKTLLGICFSLVAIIGIASRLLLVAIMLASLRALPPSAYQIIPWTMYIPHL
ncbi:hypothetical protein JVU11DRAFT_2944 [Chiua virens]|nr:hypothetical protein JVU11DRAFT_2944 [Chiua virens]